MKLVSDFKKEQIVLNRKIKFKNSKQVFDGIPLMMPSDEMYSTFEVANALPNVLTFINDDYEVEELYNFYFNDRPNSIYKLTNGQLTKFLNLMGKLPKGYLQNVLIVSTNFNDDLNLIKELRKKHKNVTIWYQWGYGSYSDPVQIDHLTSAGVDVLDTDDKSIIKIREGFTWGTIWDIRDFLTIDIEEGFTEFRGETTSDLDRVYKDYYLPLSEKTLSEYYNECVDKLRDKLYDHGCRTIQLYEYAE